LCEDVELARGAIPMRRLKRILLFLAELGFIGLGLVGSVFLAAFFDYLENNTGIVTLLGGWLLTFAGLYLFRRKTRRWKIEYEAERWTAECAWARTHPGRAKWKRVASRRLLWLPSACAALTFFFLPVGSQIFFCAKPLVRHYRFSVPLNWMTLKAGTSDSNSFTWVFFSNEGAARFGMTPIWFNHSLPSFATFGNSNPDSPYEWYRPSSEVAEGRSTNIARTEFNVGDLVVDCWEYEHHFQTARRSNDFFHLDASVLREVLCSTRPNGKEFNFHAAFFGQKEDIAVFYRVLKGGIPTR
jgi:hypothetical protein